MQNIGHPNHFDVAPGQSRFCTELHCVGQSSFGDPAQHLDLLDEMMADCQDGEKGCLSTDALR
jgi:hypothetical protein